ncbi:hypothetical protein X777_02257 [Ooceraea biroi]|uniref:Uncharacterized protein n=1 Tax=Ooceraea biroi TaxID=2015173 RepID=A0A026WL47_OOCBI|nr:hypothetical protein X777_02257 [Ooceraea biroi]
MALSDFQADFYPRYGKNVLFESALASVDSNTRDDLETASFPAIEGTLCPP